MSLSLSLSLERHQLFQPAWPQILHIYYRVAEMLIFDFLERILILTFLPAAISQRLRNYSSGCCSFPFVSFPLQKKFKRKKILPHWE